VTLGPVEFPLGSPIQLGPDSGISATKPADKYVTLRQATQLKRAIYDLTPIKPVLLNRFSPVSPA